MTNCTIMNNRMYSGRLRETQVENEKNATINLRCSLIDGVVNEIPHRDSLHETKHGKLMS